MANELAKSAPIDARAIGGRDLNERAFHDRDLHSENLTDVALAS
jgi:hypothetical protein